MWSSLPDLVTHAGPYGLLAVAVLSIFRGWLIPRSLHKEQVRMYEQAADTLKQTVMELRQQNATLLALLGQRNDRPG